MPRDSEHVHPSDVFARDLIAVYERGYQRLEAVVRDGLRRGLDVERVGTADQRRGDATQAYRNRALAQARGILAQLEIAGKRGAGPTVNRTYSAGLFAVDRALHRSPDQGAAAAGRFGQIHTAQVDVLAANLNDSLAAAAKAVGSNLETVFQRASELERALKPGSSTGIPANFIGRRADDPYRRIALEEIGGGTVALETRRQISASLVRRLVNEGVTDALTGYVDRSGRRWPIHRYAAMAVRTTTREASTRATVARMQEGGHDLVTVSEHAHPADECSEYEGNTYSLDGSTPGYDELPEYPPFHPNCAHVIYPASANLDAFERDLGIDPPVTPPPPRPPKPGQPRPRAPKTQPPKPPRTRDPLPPPPPKPKLEDVVKTGAEVRQAVAAKVQAAAQRVEAANATRRAELDELATKIDAVIAKAQAAEAGHPDYDEAFARLEPLRARRGELEAAIARSHEEVAQAQGDAVLAELQARRPGYGTGRATNVEATTELRRKAGEAPAPKAAELLDKATSLLPREWVERSNAAGPIRKLVVSNSRAYHSGAKGVTTELRTSTDPYTTLHEYAHRLQGVLDEVRELEVDFYARRITGPDGKLAPVRKLRDEQGRWSSYSASEEFRGAWTNSYIGKDYAGGAMRKLLGRDFTDSREVLSMGLEGIMAGRYNLVAGTRVGPEVERVEASLEAWRRAAEQPGKRVPKAEIARLERRLELLHNGDHELADFILGLLATV